MQTVAPRNLPALVRAHHESKALRRAVGSGPAFALVAPRYIDRGCGEREPGHIYAILPTREQAEAFRADPRAVNYPPAEYAAATVVDLSRCFTAAERADCARERAAELVELHRNPSPVVAMVLAQLAEAA